ncbi:DUF2958 domain-containing protein [Variovorax ginsengisoli]|uniref:DUF2958 domain-containing protein n=1 Tax=Variovorax guangxiensis TaxID=1775474 RepID=UPI00240E3688
MLKWFNPCGGATWLITELDPDDDNIAYGLAYLGLGRPPFRAICPCGELALSDSCTARWASSAICTGVQTNP